MIKLAKLLAVLFAVYWLLLVHVSLNFLDPPPQALFPLRVVDYFHPTR